MTYNAALFSFYVVVLDELRQSFFWSHGMTLHWLALFGTSPGIGDGYLFGSLWRVQVTGLALSAHGIMCLSVAYLIDRA